MNNYSTSGKKISICYTTQGNDNDILEGFEMFFGKVYLENVMVLFIIKTKKLLYCRTNACIMFCEYLSTLY
jgi:hypothetical protein